MNCVTNSPSSSRSCWEAVLQGFKSCSHTMAQGCPAGPLQVPPAQWQCGGSTTGDRNNWQWICLWQHTWAQRRAECSEPSSTSLGLVSAGWETSFKCPQHPELPRGLEQGLTTLWGIKSKGEGDDASTQSLRAVQSCAGWGRLATLLHSKE